MSQEFLIQNSWLIALAVGSGLMLIWPILTKGGGTRVTVPQATLMLNQRKAVMVDIRDDDFVNNSGVVPNARRVAIKDLKDKAGTLAKTKETPLIVLCQTGARAGAAASVLKAAGYTDVFVLDGGLNAWKEAGMPVKKVQQAGDAPVKASQSKVKAGKK
ncbi:MAG: rhodanese-like domain-containing protein [Gammaproteobacteria bacterium]|uniref:rhodanese-like domain-containing protein n=1 Tax=Limnobacter sp. TaxID=2003368 RepID=UPI001DD7417B|nr:rhodanese-like domain-containing protein [Limnobacter sp.]MBU0784364.1 rhodanese-like domain-containing protein [Gammaproteobacteria bacterium]MBU0848521.1 rhodanese-like domain-containing protein [Gammaproteobacteria bacterium]MBU1267342.1 rhodanese-like domain-containing protein [Gammaproteobacteria bacterium]MBU1530367.1 rhodanese-like domain-containing protein [Gammaproteobacteria bacterium]MBU1780270.1 rhodanese-like domain-containing protein [Gammaproteobacteria bacterium]